MTTPSSSAGSFVLTGKQEHYLKRELISRQVDFEINELNSPTALQRFGAPFHSPLGEVAPVDSELPIVRYIFVNHVRNFPFLDRAREKEFWQNKLQAFLESFATKRISSSEDRLEETKRRKLALKIRKVVELMMNSGIPTASGYEERVGFEEIEAAGGANRQANEGALVANLPEGHWINGWDVNISAVREVSIKRNVRNHGHAEFILRVKRKGSPDTMVGRRYGAFVRLHRALRKEFPGKVLPLVPRKMKTPQQANGLLSAAGFGGGGGGGGGDDDDDDDHDDEFSLHSVSTAHSGSSYSMASPTRAGLPDRGRNHKKSSSLTSALGLNGWGRSVDSLALQSNEHSKPWSLSRNSSRTTLANPKTPVSAHGDSPPLAIILWKENQRVSLRAFIRLLLKDEQIAWSSSMKEFLLNESITLNEEDEQDESRRKAMDEIRLEEQRKFYELARKRARELDVYMESFRRDIVESNGLTKLFAEVRKKDKLQDLDIQYRKFAEWLRIEVAATIYHIFLAEDNSAELFAQIKRVHSLMPYTVLKNIIRLANPAAVMSAVLDLFLASPFKSRSLMQRLLSMSINDGFKKIQKSIDDLVAKVDDPVLCQKLKTYSEAENERREALRAEAQAEQIDLVVAILRSGELGAELEPAQFEKVFNAFVSYTSAVDNIHESIKSSAQYFAYLKQLLKLYTRQRDKAQMLVLISEPVTLQLFRDLFHIFYEPLIRVYKSANVYNSVTDFAVFIDDMIRVVSRAQRADVDMMTDPNRIVQDFIDLCERHEDKFYSFVHEVHIHDDGLFENLMTWLEEILEFLRNGPRSSKRLDMNALFAGDVKLLGEVNALIEWHTKRRQWHQDKTRQKMASADADEMSPVSSKKRNSWMDTVPNGLSQRDFCISEEDLESLADIDDGGPAESDEEDDAMDPIGAARRRRRRQQEALRRRAGEPEKPVIEEVPKLMEPFLVMLRDVLAD